MKVLVFEQWHGGHYTNYLETLLPRLSEIVDQVVVCVTQKAFSNLESQGRLGTLNIGANVTFSADVPPASPNLPVNERFALLKNLQSSVDKHRPDYVLVTSADSQTLAMGVLGHLGIRALPKNVVSEATFHNGYGSQAIGWKNQSKEAVYQFSYSGCTWNYMNFVNFLTYEDAVKTHRSWIPRARLVPDPVPQSVRLDFKSARSLLNIPEDGRYIGLLGSLDSRKGIREMLAAFRVAKLSVTDRLLLGGRLDPQFKRLISESYQDLVDAGRLVVIDRFLSEKEVTQGYGALDVVCSVYKNFPGLASLLLKGVAAGRPILGQNFGWTGEIIRRFQLGQTTDMYDPQQFGAQMCESLEKSALYSQSNSTIRLLKFHTPENFIETMLSNIRELAGKKSIHKVIHWDWVTKELDVAKSPD